MFMLGIDIADDLRIIRNIVSGDIDQCVVQRHRFLQFLVFKNIRVGLAWRFTQLAFLYTEDR